jgi:hypothetical protein
LKPKRRRQTTHRGQTRRPSVDVRFAISAAAYDEACRIALRIDRPVTAIIRAYVERALLWPDGAHRQKTAGSKNPTGSSSGR